MRMRQSLTEIERAFAREISMERHRRASLRRTAEQRAIKREVDRRHKRGSVRFVLLVLTLMLTAAVVTVVMFRTLYSAARLGRLAQLVQSVVHLCADSVARGTGLLAPFALDLDVDLGPKYWDVMRRVDADPHLLADHGKHRDLDVIADHDALVGLARQNQHRLHPSSWPWTKGEIAPGPALSASIVIRSTERERGA